MRRKRDVDMYIDKYSFNFGNGNICQFALKKKKNIYIKKKKKKKKTYSCVINDCLSYGWDVSSNLLKGFALCERIVDIIASNLTHPEKRLPKLCRTF